MVSDDPVSHLVFRIGIRMLCEFFGCFDDRHEEVGIEVGFLVLHKAYQTFQAHAGIDVLLRQLLVLGTRNFARTAVIL